MKQSQRVISHHERQFGIVDINLLMTKLTEEVGEVASEVYEWSRLATGGNRINAISEIGDVLIVLTVLADYLDSDIEDIYREAVQKFVKREFR